MDISNVVTSIIFCTCLLMPILHTLGIWYFLLCEMGFQAFQAVQFSGCTPPISSCTVFTCIFLQKLEAWLLLPSCITRILAILHVILTIACWSMFLMSFAHVQDLPFFLYMISLWGVLAAPCNHIPVTEKCICTFSSWAGAPHLRDIFYRMGLTDKDIVALSGGHSLVLIVFCEVARSSETWYLIMDLFSQGKAHPERSGFDGAWTRDPLKFDDSYFLWVEYKSITLTYFGDWIWEGESL